MSAVKETVYIKGDESVEVTSQTVNLGDLVELECSDPKILPRLRTIHVLKFVDSSKKYSYHRRSTINRSYLTPVIKIFSMFMK